MLQLIRTHFDKCLYYFIGGFVFWTLRQSVSATRILQLIRTHFDKRLLYCFHMDTQKWVPTFNPGSTQVQPSFCSQAIIT